jgi:hypothetical protein
MRLAQTLPPGFLLPKYRYFTYKEAMQMSRQAQKLTFFEQFGRNLDLFGAIRPYRHASRIKEIGAPSVRFIRNDEDALYHDFKTVGDEILKATQEVAKTFKK